LNRLPAPPAVLRVVEPLSDRPCACFADREEESVVP
jgi:hypothetical protein